MPNGCVVQGVKKIVGNMDDESYRYYKVTFLVVGTYKDGPANAMLADGLPDWGDQYQVQDDIDVWAYFGWKRSVTAIVDKEPNRHFDVEIEASSKPDPLRCKQDKIDNPLLTPDRISGGGVHYTEEASLDRFGNSIENSAHELIRGPKVEFDAHREDVKISQNRAGLEIELFTPMQNTVNDRPMWGFPKRCIKLKPVRWDQKFYARCAVYYERHLEFEINVITDPTDGTIKSGWDRDITDEGSKALHGHWDKAGSTGHWILDNINGKPPDHNNPTHFDRFIDRNGNPCRAILDGKGKPVETAFGRGQFICIADNIGNAVNNSDFWIPLVGSPDGVPWDQYTYYVPGEIVTLNNQDYVAITDTIPDDSPPSSSWLLLPRGSSTQPENWDVGIPYQVGDVVDDIHSDPGIIHVEKYTESNFLLLGIPLTIG